MNEAPRIYLAGPDVFWPDAKELGEYLKQLCQQRGLVGVYPLDSGVKLDRLSPSEQGHAIYQANVELIRSCHGMIANMAPFRGISMDVGTAFEMGYGIAHKLLVVGYTTDMRPYKERATPDGLFIEDFEMIDNLMVHAVTGGAIYNTPEEALDYAARHLK